MSLASSVLETPKTVDVLANFVLPLFGMMIVIFCVSSFFFSFGLRFKESKQTIRGFGVDLEISVLTLFLLMGFVMIFPGFFLYIRSTDLSTLNQQIDKLQADLTAEKTLLERAQKFTVTANLLLPNNAASSLADLDKIECWYYLDPTLENPVKANVERGIGPNSVKVKLVDMKPDDVIRRLELREHGSNHLIGFRENEYPLGPTYELRLE
jgi:hypothetical protein